LGITKGSSWESKGEFVGTIDLASKNPADF